MKRKSRTAGRRDQEQAAHQRVLPLVEVLVDTRDSLMELAVASGLQVLRTMLEEDRTAICGRRYGHRPERVAVRWGTAPSEVVLGGRKVVMPRPRVRAGRAEVPLPTFTAVSATDPLDARVLEQMLVGVATRRYARSLEPLGEGIESRGTSKSAVSRRFVAKTAAQLAAWQTAPLDRVDLIALFIDGVGFADDCVVVALGVDVEGRKHALGVWHGSTENATLCQGLLRELQGRGLRTDRSMLVVLDGSKALAKAVRYAFDRAAVVQRCQVHKLRNVLEYLPDGQRPWVRAQMQRAYQANDVRKATRLLTDLARRLETEYPSAAESLREGLEETLTVMRLALSPRLQRTFATTNPIENLIGGTRRVHRNVKRWRNGIMMQRWAAAGILEAAKGFRRIKGHRDLPSLVQVLRARDRELGLDQDPSTAAVA